MALEAKQTSTFIKDLKLYKNSDSHHFFLFLRENRILLSILNENYRVLNKILQYHNDKNVTEKIWHSDPTFRFRLQKQIVRHLSNYLSSLFSVVDYSRKTLIKYIALNNDIFEVYNKEKSIFLNKCPSHKFLQDLRNYTSHNTFIKIGSEFSYNIEWLEPRKSVYIEKSEILKWSGWKSDAKEFIDKHDEKIRLNNILKEHYSQFIYFQNWAYLQLFLIDENKTEVFLNDIQTIYNKAIAANMAHLLIFKESYIRYISFAYQKALQKRGL